MSPDEMRVLGILFLVLVHRLGGRRGERGVLRLKERQHILVHSQARNRRNLILRHRVQKNPAEAVAVVVLIVTPQIGLVPLALIVKDRMAERRWLDASIRRRVAIQDIVAELLADRASVFERRVHGLIRAAEPCEEPKPGLVPLLLVISTSRAVLLPYCASMPPRMISARSHIRGEITSVKVELTPSGIGTPSIRNCWFAWS